MGKKYLFIISFFLLCGCAKEIIKEEDFKISADVNSNSSKTAGFKTLTSYTDENYRDLEKKTKEESDKEFEIVKSTQVFEKDSDENKNWLKRDWPFALGILGVAAAAALIF